ncbi:hypothetical protein SLE2022_260260 [Rubroshorea leprosula]
MVQEKKRDVEPEEEDDEVAYSNGETDGKYLTQDMQDKKGIIEAVAESSVRIQNSNEDINSAAEKGAMQQQGNLEIVVEKLGSMRNIGGGRRASPNHKEAAQVMRSQLMREWAKD